uniref:Uncharacterized protein n=2 Tax=Aegilops tauschii subsp. strangulata TaxID=200361 RepID=A0A453N4Q4_AEGTS
LSPLSSHVLSPPLPLTHPPTSLDFDLDREAPAARLFLSLPTTASHLPRRAIRGAPPPSFFSPTPTGDGGEVKIPHQPERLPADGEVSARLRPPSPASTALPRHGGGSLRRLLPSARPASRAVSAKMLPSSPILWVAGRRGGLIGWIELEMRRRRGGRGSGGDLVRV